MLFTNKLDVIEDDIRQYEKSILNALLFDRTTRRNIIWATDIYEYLGPEYEFHHEILPSQITGQNSTLIQPRASKPTDEQLIRTRDKGEVFTPCWLCNKQNNLIDEQWFGKSNVFNSEEGENWTETKDRIIFPEHRSWKNYVDTKRLEVCCGEAPYLVSRYDSVTGLEIPIQRRIGLLDRKLRVVSEQTVEETEWVQWAIRAFQSVYAFEFQGDNLLLARENLLITFIDYYFEKFHRLPSKEMLLEITRYISWNLWQMDGSKAVVPDSCTPIIHETLTLFGTEVEKEPCPGCVTGDAHKHTGVYCKIYDWRAKKSITYVSLIAK